jgi:hypothetical protein
MWPESNRPGVASQWDLGRPDINDPVKRLNARLRDLPKGADPLFDLNAILADGEALDPRNSFDGLHLNVRAVVGRRTRSGVARRAAMKRWITFLRPAIAPGAALDLLRRPLALVRN